MGGLINNQVSGGRTWTRRGGGALHKCEEWGLYEESNASG